MITVDIKENDHFFINGSLFESSFCIAKAKMIQVLGENGIGKSSLLQYLALHQRRFFGDESPYFLDQLRLSPLNSVNYLDVKDLLSKDRLEKLSVLEVVEAEMKDFIHLPIKELSGGQNQLVKLALMLFISADIFFLDEPFQYLDRKKQALLRDILEYLKQQKKAIVIIEHQRDLASLVDKQYEVVRFTNRITLRELDCGS